MEISIYNLAGMEPNTSLILKDSKEISKCTAQNRRFSIMRQHGLDGSELAPEERLDPSHPRVDVGGTVPTCVILTVRSASVVHSRSGIKRQLNLLVRFNGDHCSTESKRYGRDYSYCLINGSNKIRLTGSRASVG